MKVDVVLNQEQDSDEAYMPICKNYFRGLTPAARQSWKETYEKILSQPHGLWMHQYMNQGLTWLNEVIAENNPQTNIKELCKS